MFWRGKQDNLGWVTEESVQMYELSFRYTFVDKRGIKRKTQSRCLVVADTVEDAIKSCREKYPEDWVLDQVVKRNQRCSLIICESALKSLTTDEPSTATELSDGTHG